MIIIFSLIFILAVSYVFTFIARRLHSSDVIGLILAGIFLSLPFFGFLLRGNEEIISVLSIAGLFSLMFLAGFEVSWNLIIKEEKHSLIITLTTVFFSLVIGTLVMMLMGFNLSTSLVVGVCFGITAEAAKARVLLQLKKITSKLGSILMGSGITNDVIGMILFVIVLFSFSDRVVWYEFIILMGSIVSFALGSLVHYRFDRYSSRFEKMEQYMLFGLVPFFFLEMGMGLSKGFNEIDWGLFLLIILSVSTSQVLGVFLAKPFLGLRPKQLLLLGWGMNAKGSVELAIAHMALMMGLFSLGLYSSMVLMTLITSIMFQVVIVSMVKSDPGIMD